VKLHQAEELYRGEARFLPAERLFREALAIFEQRGDRAGVAETYRQLGFFFRSPVPRGIIAPDDFAADRYVTSTQYFLRAASVFGDIGAYDDLSNAYYDLGENYSITFKDAEMACAYFEKSRAAAHEAVRRDPELKVNVPPKFSSFDAFIDDVELQRNCK
jgi:tetratricopeptide (TPR) repeat protein